MSKPDGIVKGLALRSDKFAEESDFGPYALLVNLRLTELAPKGARYWFRLGLCLKSNGQPRKARKAFERGLKIDPQYLVKIDLERQSERFFDKADFGPEALEVNRRLTELRPSNQLYSSRLKACLSQAENREKAPEAFERALEIEGLQMAGETVRDALERRSEGLIEVGDFGPDALEANRLLTQIEPTNAVHWARLGRCVEMSGDLRKAQLLFERALELDPSHVVAANRLHGIRNRLHARSEVATVFDGGGREALRSLISSTRDTPGKTFMRLEGRLFLSQLPDADVWDRIGLAREVGRSGKHEEALRLYREAYREGGADVKVKAAASVGAAAVLRRMNESKQAERLCRKVLQADREDGPAWATLGAALADQKRLREADAAFAAAKRFGWRTDRSASY